MCLASTQVCDGPSSSHRSLTRDEMDIQNWLATRLSRIEMEFIEGTCLKEELDDLVCDLVILTGDVTLGNLTDFYSMLERCDHLIEKFP